MAFASINPHNRKLQPSYNDMSFQPINTLHITSPPPQVPPSQSSNTTPPPFDPSMALTVLVLLTVLFFMGFFSVYLRRFSTNQTPALSSIRRNDGGGHRLSTLATASHKGVDPEVIKSLPVHDYYHGDGKYHQNECAICLGEFEEKESVKMIPYCKHVFHMDCIDTWLKMHVTCPVCRGTQFLETEDGSGGGGGRSTVENSDDHRIEVGSSGSRCSVLGERILVRTSGF